jgi:hypothetical protein
MIWKIGGLKAAMQCETMEFHLVEANQSQATSSFVESRTRRRSRLSQRTITFVEFLGTLGVSLTTCAHGVCFNTTYTGLYCTFGNKLASESRFVLHEIQERLPDLQYPSHPSVGGNYWAARSLNSAGLNINSSVATEMHTDYENWAPNFCCVTAIGRFDPTKGGHIVFWNISLAIEFPPGCSILFPSALITHSNIPIQPGEIRYSIVQYSAGALFRWVYNGFKTDKEFFESATADQLNKWEEDKRRRWQDELRLFTKWHELVKGDYKGEELGDLSELSSEEDSDDTSQILEKPRKRRKYE